MSTIKPGTDNAGRDGVMGVDPVRARVRVRVLDPGDTDVQAGRPAIA